MIAVIIPAYNRPDALRHALQSLTQQTESHFVTVVVDDASTEDIYPLCEEFNQTLNVVYLRQAVNGGPGAARIRGIEWAIEHNIDFVMFLDSDDQLLAHAVRVLKYEITHTGADMIFSDIVCEHKHQPHIVIPADQSLTWVHGKIYRTKFLESLHIQLPADLRTNEDLAFNLICKWTSKICLYTHQATYLWCEDERSLTRSVGEERNLCMGADFIRANYTALDYMWNYAPQKFEEKAEDALHQVIACYNYYQLSLIRNEDVTDMDWRITAMLSHPTIQKLCRLISVWKRLDGCISSYSVIPATQSTKSYLAYYKHTFYEWYIAHGGVVPEGAI